AFDVLGVLVGTLSPPLPPVPRPSRLRDRDGVVDEDEEDDEGDAAALEAASCAANLVLPAYGSWGTSLIGRRVCPAPKREKKKQTQSYRLHCIKQLNECRHQRGSDGALLVKPTVITSTYTRTSFGNCISISIITAHETPGNKASNIE